MSEPSLPKFPATPEEIKAASEKAMNFWVGALSPMWVPFWAASSFGLGAWAVSQSLSKTMGEGLASPDALMKDLPAFGVPGFSEMAAKWSAFPGAWGAFGGVVAEKTAPEHSPVPIPEMYTVVGAAMVAEISLEEAENAALTEVPTKAEVVPEPQPKVTRPKAAKTVAASVAKAPEPVKIEPKPIAKAMSAAKPPKPKA